MKQRMFQCKVTVKLVKFKHLEKDWNLIIDIFIFYKLIDVLLDNWMTFLTFVPECSKLILTVSKQCVRDTLSCLIFTLLAHCFHTVQFDAS